MKKSNEKAVVGIESVIAIGIILIFATIFIFTVNNFTFSINATESEVTNKIFTSAESLLNLAPTKNRIDHELDSIIYSSNVQIDSNFEFPDFGNFPICLLDLEGIWIETQDGERIYKILYRGETKEFIYNQKTEVENDEYLKAFDLTVRPGLNIQKNPGMEYNILNKFIIQSLDDNYIAAKDIIGINPEYEISITLSDKSGSLRHFGNNENNRNIVSSYSRMISIIDDNEDIDDLYKTDNLNKMTIQIKR